MTDARIGRLAVVHDVCFGLPCSCLVTVEPVFDGLEVHPDSLFRGRDPSSGVRVEAPRRVLEPRVTCPTSTLTSPLESSLLV